MLSPFAARLRLSNRLAPGAGLEIHVHVVVVSGPSWQPAGDEPVPRPGDPRVLAVETVTRRVTVAGSGGLRRWNFPGACVVALFEAVVDRLGDDFNLVAGNAAVSVWRGRGRGSPLGAQFVAQAPERRGDRGEERDRRSDNGPGGGVHAGGNG